jgi:hypothetical protein
VQRKVVNPQHLECSILDEAGGTSVSGHSRRFRATPKVSVPSPKADIKPRGHNALKSPGTSPNFLITFAPLKSTVLWLQSNETFVPSSGTTHFDLHRMRRASSCTHRGCGGDPARPQCANACGFSNGLPLALALASAANLNLRRISYVCRAWNGPQLKVLSPYHRNFGQLTVTESVVLPPQTERQHGTGIFA